MANVIDPRGRDADPQFFWIRQQTVSMRGKKKAPGPQEGMTKKEKNSENSEKEEGRKKKITRELSPKNQKAPTLVPE